MAQVKRLVSLLLIFCLMFSCIPVRSARAAGTTAIQDLEVDQRTNPMGIDNRTPEFRWEMVSDVRGQKQTAYEIAVTDDEGHVVWDSGKVASDRSIAIPYEGEALVSATRYTWTVTIWDKDGVQLPVESAWFETGLLEKSDWQGVFIAPEKAPQDTVGDYTIELDFQVVQDGAGISFGGKGSEYLMWQVNVHDFSDLNPDYHGENKVYFRPHAWAPGGACLKEIDISDAIPWEKAYDINHMKIEVVGNHIKTYINQQLVWETDHRLAAFGEFGVRQYADFRVTERASYDNLVITDTTHNKVLCSCDFEQDRGPFTFGELRDGMLYVALTETRVNLLAKAGGSSAPMFRKEFTVNPDKELRSARLYATSLGIYEAYLNGQKIGVDKLAPGWTDYEEYVQYQTYDIANQLVKGENVIGAIVGNGWYSGHVSTAPRVNRYGVDEAFLGQIVLTYTDGSTEVIGTDDTWAAYLDGPYVETCNQNGETYDATREVPGWCTAEFDASAWMPTMAATKDTIDTLVDPVAIRRVAQPDDPVQVTEERIVTFVAEPEPGVYIYDLGQNISGWVQVNNIKGTEGQTMRLRYGEMLYKDTQALYTANLRSAKATDYYTLKGDPAGETYEPCFTFHGFRYLEITGLDYRPDPADITGKVVHSKLERTGWFETNSPNVNQLFSNITWGQRDNYLSIPTDCPQRDERLGWSGDAQAFSRTASLNFDIDAFYTKYLRDVEAARNRKTGAIYDIAPAKGHEVGEGNHGWGDVAIVAPWTLYTAYGDKSVLEENWQMMSEWITYYQNKAGADLLLPSDSYGDWLSIGENTPKTVTAEAYFAHSTALMAKMARALGKEAEAQAYDELFLQIREAFNKAYVNPVTGVITGNSQTAYLVALNFDLLPTEELQQKATEHLLARLEANNMHLTTGFLGVGQLLPVLCDRGYADVAYDLLLTETYPSWLYSVVNGATTVWERWNSYIAETGTFGNVGMNSFNHYAYGSVGEWMYQYAAGINFDEADPGYKHIIIRPVPNGKLNDIRGELESVYGRIVSDWTLIGSDYELSVTIPANTTATVYVPSYDESKLLVDGTAKGAGVEGVTYVGTTGTTAQFEIDSGTYAFSSLVEHREKVSINAGVDKAAEGMTMVKITMNGEEKKHMSVETGTQITLEAEAVNSAEFVFNGWTGDVTSMENPLTITADKDLNVTASFRYVGLSNLAAGKTVTGSNAANVAEWNLGNLTDGLLTHKGSRNGYTTNGMPSPDVNEWLIVDLGKDTAFNRVQLYPRTDSFAAGGTTAFFPKDFTIEVSSDGKTFTPIITETDYAAPYLVPAVFEMGAQNARYVKLNVTKLGDMASDDTVNRLQLVEIGVYNMVEGSQFALNLDQVGGGQLKVDGQLVELPYTAEYAAGTEVTVEAVDPDAQITFSGWSGTIYGTDRTVQLIMNEPKNLTAQFKTPGDRNLALHKPVSSNTSLNMGAASDWDSQKLTDGDTQKGTGYSSEAQYKTPDCNIWIDIDLGDNQLIDTIVLYPRNTPDETAADGKTPSYPEEFTIEVKQKGSAEYVVCKTLTGQLPEPGQPMEYVLDQPVSCSIFRIHATKCGLMAVADTIYRVQLTEAELYNRRFVTSIDYEGKNVVQMGETLQPRFTATLQDGSKLDLTAMDLPAVYGSSENSVATVDTKGVVTPVSVGTTTIDAVFTVNGAEQKVSYLVEVQEAKAVVDNFGQSLSLDDNIYINSYVTVTGIDKADVEANGGLLIWKTSVTEEEAVVGSHTAVNKAGLKAATVDGQLVYGQQTDGIQSTEYADPLYLRSYVKKADGSYVYGPLTEYSVRIYVDKVIEQNTPVKDTAIQLAHFGAASQLNFKYNVEDLANSHLADYPAAPFRTEYLDELAPFTTTIQAADDVVYKGKTLSLDDRIMLNFYFDAQDFEVRNAELLVWNSAAGELTESNADKTVSMTLTTKGYGAQAGGFISTAYGKTIYACAKMTDAQGMIHYSAVVSASPESYAKAIIEKSTNETLVAAVKQMVVYGETAAAYFANK